MPERVVHLLEVVEVEQQHGGLLVRADRGVGVLVEQEPVGEPGQRVMMRRVGELLREIAEFVVGAADEAGFSGQQHHQHQCAHDQRHEQAGEHPVELVQLLLVARDAVAAEGVRLGGEMGHAAVQGVEQVQQLGDAAEKVGNVR